MQFFSDLKAELAARGFDYLSSARQGQYINWAGAELMEIEDWPFRRRTTSITPPNLTITGGGDTQGHFGTVFDLSSGTRRQLIPAPLEYLESEYGDLTTTGTPIFWYVKESVSNGDLTIATYPVGTGTLRYAYFILWADKTSDADFVSDIPPRWHRLLIDIAVRMAYRDADNHEAAEAMQAQIERDLMQMRAALLVDHVGGPDGYITTTWGDW